MTFGHGGPTDPFGRDPFAGDASFDATAFGAAPAPVASGREVNTLATLSVVFAFVFAPAGALLGHLGLAQLGRTGQRGRDRALVGLTLSYLFITVAVVSLVVWMAIGTPSTPPNIASPPTTSTQTSAAPATTTNPPSAGAPTLTAIAPPGPLLNLDEMKAILGTPANRYAPAPLPVPDLAAYPSFDTVDTTLQTQGRISDANCAAMVFAGTAVAFQGVDMQAIQQVTMAQPGPQGTQSVTETAVSFASPAAANAALTHYLGLLDPCKGRTVTLTTAPQGAVYQTRTVHRRGAAVHVHRSRWTPGLHVRGRTAARPASSPEVRRALRGGARVPGERQHADRRLGARVPVVRRPSRSARRDRQEGVVNGTH